MAAVGEVHGEDFVAGLEDAEIDGHVCLAAAVGLDIDMFGAEEEPGAVDGKLLDDIDVFAAAVPAASGVALGVFVGEAGALRFHDGAAGEVLGGDQLDVFGLAFFLGADGRENIRVALGEGGIGPAGAGEVVELADAALVATALEWGLEPGIDDLDGLGLVDVRRAEAEDIGVVVAAGDAGGVLAVDEGGADVLVAVGGDAHADACFTNEDAEIVMARDDVAADGFREIGVIDRIGGGGAEVGDDAAFCQEVGVDFFLQFEAAVVGSDGDAECFCGCG